MAWTPITKFTVILSSFLFAGGFYVLTNLFFVTPDLLTPLALGTYNHTETWGIIGTILMFLAWWLMFLGLKLESL
jgi:hypothetical protein